MAALYCLSEVQKTLHIFSKSDKQNLRIFHEISGRMQDFPKFDNPGLKNASLVREVHNQFM